MGLLNAPITIHGMNLSNRLVMPPMFSAKAESNGKVTDDLCKYYDEKTKGGYIGLVIVEHSFVCQTGKASRGQLSISDDNDVPGLMSLTAAVHRHKTSIIAQINHVGSAAKEEITGYAPMSASSIRMPKQGLTEPLPKEMSLSDIDNVIVDFTLAALRAKTAGFDGVEIQAAHGYLLNQFYSPLTNKRDDVYSCYTIEGRIRLHLEIITAIREAVGNDYPIALRLGACDYMDNGTTIQDSIIACKAFQQAGVNLIDISGGFCKYTRPDAKDQGYFSELSEVIKKNISVPVILTGGIVDADAAEALLQSGKADLIGVGRAIQSDSDWPRRSMEMLH